MEKDVSQSGHATTAIEPASSNEGPRPEPEKGDVSACEVFQETSEGVNFRSVSWQRATVLFLKIQFAMSILAVPAALGTLGAVGGALSIVGWQVLNTYTAIILGDFRNRHPECHTLADMCGLPMGKAGRELVGAMILVAQVLIVAAGDVSISTALNALSGHGACTAVFTLVAAVLVTGCSSVRTFSRLGWLTWFGFATFAAAVLVFTVAVARQDRPAAAPPEEGGGGGGGGGDFDLGFVAFASPGFAAGMTATVNIFISGSGSSMYLPIISEMRRPRDYRRAALVAGLLVGALYLSLSLVVYRYCGVWLATPAFGSAGGLFKKVSYGVALPGLVVGTGIYSHVAAKYLFVRLLRGSRHLQEDTPAHWAAWLGANLLLGALSYVVAEAVPILNYLLALAGSLCFAPFSLVLPAVLWMHDFGHLRSGAAGERVVYGAHLLIVLVGTFLVVGGTYGAAVSIRQAFASGLIGGVFDCADNSGTIS